MATNIPTPTEFYQEKEHFKGEHIKKEHLKKNIKKTL